MNSYATLQAGNQTESSKVSASQMVSEINPLKFRNNWFLTPVSGWGGSVMYQLRWRKMAIGAA